MNLLDGLKKNNLTENTKGSKYYKETYDANLDVFSMLSRYNPTDTIISKFDAALVEDEKLALANLLYILDIRGGKGERLLFKTIFKNLCQYKPDKALKVLPFIKELGRYDYILDGINTPIEDEVIKIIKEQLEEDLKSEHPSLLAKWLPSHRTHYHNVRLSHDIRKKLGMSEKEYRQTLSLLRSKINIVEKNLTRKEYDKINFSQVPTKAMLKYRSAFEKYKEEDYKKYLDEVAEGSAKINTVGLFCHEIIKKVNFGAKTEEEEKLLDLMWKNQKDILAGNDDNILVMADTSGSMTMYGGLPFFASVGLAIYIAERNKGVFHNHFITFSREPQLQKIKGSTIVDKVNNIEVINDCTDIDKAFKLLLDTAVENKIKEKDMPKYIIIISDMEFDRGVYTKNGTNFDGWKKAFKGKKYNLPKIIFWNVAAHTQGVPVSKYDKDVMMISGFSTNILENLLNLDEVTPMDVMILKLSKYLEMLGE